MSSRDNKGIEPEERYYKQVTPLKYNPYEGLISSYINDAPMGTVSHPDTFQIAGSPEIQATYKTVKQWVAIFRSNTETVRQYKADGWQEAIPPDGTRSINGIVKQFWMFDQHRWLYKMVQIEDIPGQAGTPSYNKVLERTPYGDMPTDKQNVGYSPQYYFDPETGQVSKSIDSGYGPYYTFQPGYTMTFNSTVAFLVPEFYYVNKADTFKMWANNKNLKGYIIITPENDAIPNVLDIFGLERTTLRMRHSLLWALKPNIAFQNEVLYDQVPDPSLSPGTKKSLHLSVSYNPITVAHTIDDIPPEFHPLSGNFTDIGSFLNNFIAGFLKMYYVTRMLMRPPPTTSVDNSSTYINYNPKQGSNFVPFYPAKYSPRVTFDNLFDQPKNMEFFF